MSPRELQMISALSVFLTAALPAAAGAIAFRAQPILAVTLNGEPGSLPGLTGFYFNHFIGALGLLLALGGISTLLALRAHFKKTEDAVVRMASLLAATCFSALVSVVFLALLVLATALPVYSKLMQR
jgi:hypothetical protein